MNDWRFFLLLPFDAFHAPFMSSVTSVLSCGHCNAVHCPLFFFNFDCTFYMLLYLPLAYVREMFFFSLSRIFREGRKMDMTAVSGKNA
jgi:hypothetical protein